MFTIKIAGLLVEIDNRYEKIRERCKDYIVMPNREPDIRVATTDVLMRFWAEHLLEGMAPEDIELNSLHCRIYLQLPYFDAAWMHASAVEVDGKGYAFTAPSGYGKTTQSRLWLQYFGSRARIINGDNPIIRFMDGDWYICGTPFAGTEGYQVNTQVPLKGICYLNHSEDNQIIRMAPEMAYIQMIQTAQNHGMMNDENKDSLMGVWERIVEQVSFWQLYCNRTIKAVEVAYREMNHTTECHQGMLSVRDF